MTDKTDSKERVTEEMVHAALKAKNPTLYRDHLRHPSNGPVLRASTEKEIQVTRKMLEAALGASLAANAVREPVAWGIFDSQGFYEAADGQESAERFCAHYNKRTGADPLKPYTAKPLYLHPSPPGGMVGGWLNPEDMAALQRADECFDDGEGHDLPKARVDRLIELGVMRHNGGGYYSITSFGSFVLGCEHRHLPLETSSECNERLGREHKERRLMDKSAPPTSSADSRKGE